MTNMAVYSHGSLFSRCLINRNLPLLLERVMGLYCFLGRILGSSLLRFWSHVSTAFLFCCSTPPLLLFLFLLSVHNALISTFIVASGCSPSWNFHFRSACISWELGEISNLLTVLESVSFVDSGCKGTLLDDYGGTFCCKVSMNTQKVP